MMSGGSVELLPGWHWASWDVGAETKAVCIPVRSNANICATWLGTGREPIGMVGVVAVGP